MKRFLACLLAILMLGTAVATAEDLSLDFEPDEGTSDEEKTLTILVTDEQGDPLPGAEVVIRDAHNKVVETHITDETARLVLEGLAPDSLYIVRATDPADGYSSQRKVFLDQAIEITLLIRGRQAGSELTVGSLTRVTGKFFTDLWSNNTSDLDVRALIHALGTVNWDSDMQYTIDETTVADVQVQELDGEKVYTFTLHEDIQFSDGSRVTARDYVFSVLLLSSPQLRALGAQGQPFGQLVGYDAFASGESDVFEGVRLLGDYSFSLSIDSAYLPYFYELMYVNVTPYPMDVILPGCTVADDGQGAYIAPIKDEGGNPQGEFTQAVLEETILNPETGYMSHPSVTSGAYRLTGYDEETGVVDFEINPYYRGNYEGYKPVIETLHLRTVSYDSMLEELKAGTVDIVNKTTMAQAVEDGRAMVGEGELQASSYLRAGYGFVNFACEEGPTQFVKVRQAIAHAFDAEGYISAYLGSYGMPVYSHYGLGQWMVKTHIGEMQELVTGYPYDLAAAKALLVEDGWTLNAQGGEFVEGIDDVRYKQVSETELMPLHVDYAQSIGNTGAQLVGSMLSTVLDGLGFDVEIHEIEYQQLLRHFYRTEERTYELMFLASNFTFVYDPYYSFLGDEQYQGLVNTSGIDDEELADIALQMRRVPSGDADAFTEKWLELMARYSDVLPTLPIYSNIYFDFFGTDVQGYSPSSNWSWPAAIIYTYIEAPAETTGSADDVLVLD